MRISYISNKRPEKFVSCRVGLELCNFNEDLANVLEHYKIGSPGNFIVAPVAPPRSTYYDDNNHELPFDGDDSELNLLPDLVVSPEVWEQSVAVSIGQLPQYSSDSKVALEKFDRLFMHALYLPTPVIVIDCPEISAAQASVASIVNERLEKNTSEKIVLFKVPLGSSPVSHGSDHVFNNHGMEQLVVEPAVSHPTNEITDDSNSESGIGNSSTSSQDSAELLKESVMTDWNLWNSFRSHLVPDHRIGVCLAIKDDIESDIEQLARWTGEPVRMITLNVDRFSSRRGFPSSFKPAGCIKEFLRQVALSNSLATSFVVQAKAEYEVIEHLNWLANFCDTLARDHEDVLRAWDDILLSPLQPLSTNLDSGTYQIFESDLVKYSRYQDAMTEALAALMMRQGSKDRRHFIIMVLGAGRGPLVDAMIRAIHRLNLRTRRFKIYALDKNYSSIRSLKFKQRRFWSDFLPTIETEVVEADMRVWEPAEKADIIATELLGSFSDNELSPECIDGTWRFATEDTISIPESYSSYLAPICSYRMRQELHKSRFFSCKANIYDEIQVVRMTNYYSISPPQELFHFQHTNLARQPIEGSNQREATLSFKAHVDTVCHGFAGYFAAKLFGFTTISTVPDNKTPTMESWFPAFIPLEEPIQVPAGYQIVVKFSRKESLDKVWYEWMVLSPKQSRPHSLGGIGTAMSKIIK